MVITTVSLHILHKFYFGERKTRKEDLKIMASITVINCRALICGQIKYCNLKIVDGKIRGIMPPGDTYGKTFDAKNKILLPGMIDIHTHGALGTDFNTSTPEEICAIRDYYASQGVTTFLPTIHGDTVETMTNSITAISRAKSTMGCTQIFGINLEGPFLAPSYAGSMDKNNLIPCNYSVFKKLQDASGGNIRITTISPELEGATELIRKLSMEGVKVCIGHSGADYTKTEEAINGGAICGTHMFHSMKMMRPSNPAITTAILESDIFCEVICDPKLIHPAMIRLLIKTKGMKRIIGITDSMKTTGAKDGFYKVGCQDVVLSKGETRMLNEDKNAGSMMTAMNALKNFIETTELSLAQSMVFFTENPAKMLGIYHAKGSIDVGKDADLIMVDDDLNIISTFSRGEVIYSKT